MGGSGGPLDPLSEAFVLGRKAVTARQRLQALEAIRSATKLALKGTTVDREQREQLDRHLRDAEREYRDAPTFDLAVRGCRAFARRPCRRSRRPGRPAETLAPARKRRGAVADRDRAARRAGPCVLRNADRMMRDVVAASRANVDG